MTYLAHIETGLVSDVRSADTVEAYRALFAGIDTSGWRIVAVADASVEGSPAPTEQAPPLEWDAFTFKTRFTQAERMAIRAAAKSSAQVEDFMDMLNTAASVGKLIVASDPLLVEDLAALVSAGLLAAGRDKQILGIG